MSSVSEFIHDSNKRQQLIPHSSQLVGDASIRFINSILIPFLISQIDSLRQNTLNLVNPESEMEWNRMKLIYLIAAAN